MHLSSWPTSPERSEAEPVVRVIHDVHAGAPEEGVVECDPALLRETDFGLLLGYAAPRGQWSQHIVHGSASGTREDNDPVEDEKDVVPAKRVGASPRVVVGDPEELGCMVSSVWKEEVDEKECGEEVQGNACNMSVIVRDI